MAKGIAESGLKEITRLQRLTCLCTSWALSYTPPVALEAPTRSAASYTAHWTEDNLGKSRDWLVWYTEGSGSDLGRYSESSQEHAFQRALGHTAKYFKRFCYTGSAQRGLELDLVIKQILILSGYSYARSTSVRHSRWSDSYTYVVWVKKIKQFTLHMDMRSVTCFFFIFILDTCLH